MADGYMPRSARPYSPRSARPVRDEHGVLDALGRGVGDVVDFMGEGVGALESAFPRLQLRPGEFFDPSVPTPATPTYQDARDRQERILAETAEDQPLAYYGGKIGAGVALPAVGGAAGGLKGAMGAGAVQGAVSGLGSSSADLTLEDAREYARAFGDTLKGGAFGAGAGALGHGVGAGIRAVGRKAKDVLGRARGEMLDDVSAARATSDEAAREADISQQRDMAVSKQEALKIEEQRLAKADRAARQQAREAAKKAVADARAARQSGRQQPSDAPGPSEDTDVLQGYRGAAGRRWADNDPKVRGYMEELKSPDLPPARREKLENYLKGHGDVFNDPAAFERRIMVEEMRRAGYSRDQIERIMRERVGPDLEVRSRRTPEPAQQRALPERTQAGDWEDLARVHGENPAKVREVLHGPGARNMGARAFGEDTGVQWNRETLEQQARDGMDDVFHDAKTRVGLVRTSPEEGIEGILEQPVHTFEFSPRGGESFEVVAYQPRPGEVYVESVKPVRASSVFDMYGEAANSLGPRAMRSLSEELSRAFPGAQRITGMRVTGANPLHKVDVRAPEVTTVSPSRGNPRAPSAVDDVFHDAETKVGLVRVTPPEGVPNPDNGQMLHHFRFIDPKTKAEFELQARASPHDKDTVVIDGVGRVGEDFVESWEANANTLGPLLMRQLFRDLARAFPGRSRVGGVRVTGINGNQRGMSIRAPEVTQQMDLSDAAKQGRGPDLQGAGGGGASAFGDRFADAPTRVGPPDFMGEDLPLLDEITQPGAGGGPLLAVQRVSPLSAPPGLRAGASYQRYGQPRAAPPPVDEEIAMRRAMGAGAQVGAGPVTPMPTRGAPASRPPPMDDSMAPPIDRAAPPPPTATFRSPSFEDTRAEGTRAVDVPEVRRPVPMDPTRLLPRPERTQVGAPSIFSDRTAYGPPGLETRLAARPSVEELAAAREAQGGQDIRRAFLDGASGEGAAAYGLGGLVLGGLEGGLAAVAARGGIAAVREVLKNPAARARAVTAFKLERLARTRPEVFARVSGALQRAMDGGPNRYAAARHAFLMRDPEYRQAEAEADRELQGLDEDALAAKLSGR